jgi:hypothetical protein
MTLLTVVKDVCAAVGVEIPTSVFVGLNNNRTMQEMLALANETALAIAYDSGHDWQVLKERGEFVGGFESGTEFGVPFFDFPQKFKRFLLTSNLWRSTTAQYPMRFISDADEWLQRRLWGWFDPRGEWMVQSNSVLIMPPLRAAVPANPAAVPPVLAVPAERVVYAYFNRNCIIPVGQAHGETDVFRNDGDGTWIDERLLKLAMIWKWKQLKGSPYAEDMSTYNDALAMAIGKDKPAPIIVGRVPISAAVSASYPFPVDPGMVPL